MKLKAKYDFKVGTSIYFKKNDILEGKEWNKEYYEVHCTSSHIDFHRRTSDNKYKFPKFYFKKFVQSHLPSFL